MESLNLKRITIALIIILALASTSGARASILTEYKQIIQCNSCNSFIDFKQTVSNLQNLEAGKYLVLNTLSEIASEVLVYQDFGSPFLAVIPLTSYEAYSHAYESKTTPLRELATSGVPFYFYTTELSYLTFNQELLSKELNNNGFFFRLTPFAPLNLNLGTIITVVFKNGDRINVILTDTSSIQWKPIWDSAVDKDGKPLGQNQSNPGEENPDSGSPSSYNPDFIVIAGAGRDDVPSGQVVIIDCKVVDCSIYTSDNDG